MKLVIYETDICRLAEHVSQDIQKRAKGTFVNIAEGRKGRKFDREESFLVMDTIGKLLKAVERPPQEVRFER